MGRKVFVSYKYKDEQVKDLNKREIVSNHGHYVWASRATRVRDYVDELQDKIGKENMNLGEKDGESLEDFSDEKIESELKKKIFQSSVTIVMLSKGMKVAGDEKDQWIPWEVSYSLRVVPRADKTSQMNAVLGVVLPDETGTYDWYYTSNANCNSVTHHTGKLFKILRTNMFNIKEQEFRECSGTKIHTTDEPSFIKTVKWDDFMFLNSYDSYIDVAIEIKENKDLYDVKINLTN